MSVYHVTNTTDSGTGSFRDAVSGSNRLVVFDVGGTIALGSQCYVSGSYITVAGETAPSPGITFTGHTVYVRNGVHDIILRNFRHRGGWNGSGGSQQDADGITITVGCYNIVVQNVSIAGVYDENLDVWDTCHDITVQDCILGVGADPTHNFSLLIGKQSHRVTVARNIMYGHEYRAPAAGYDDVGSLIEPTITADVVNNLIWTSVASSYGPTSYHQGKSNIVGNYIKATTNVELTSGGLGYLAGNHNVTGSLPSSNGGPFTVDPYATITPSDYTTAARYALAHAGCRVGGLDSTDLGYIAAIGTI